MICDLLGIVNEGFTIPGNSVHKNIFLCEKCVWSSDSSRIARV